VHHDRYEPLPGLLSLPRFLYRKLGPRGRIVVKVGSAMLAVAVTAAVLVLAPRISASKHERAERERREAAVALAARQRQIIEEQRPHRTRAAPAASRATLVAELEERIMADVRARVGAGKLAGPAAKEVECEPIRHGQNTHGSRVVYDCLAVTSRLPSIGDTPRGAIGHPFRGVVQFPIERLTWCKISGRTIEDLPSRNLAAIPRACSL
jgi:hypothetical protein